MQAGRQVGTEGGSERIPAIDWLKAIALVAVAINHGGPFLMGPHATSYDHFVRGGLTQFHVPTFLLVSGFLYYRPVPQELRAVGRRLARFLVPYLVGSAVAFALGVAWWRTWVDVLTHLAFGSAVGSYYYFFLLAVMVLTIWPLSRLPPAGVAAVLAAVCGYAVTSSAFPRTAFAESMYWHIRDPLHLGGYFLCGWLVAAWREPLARLGRRWRPALWVLAALLVGAWVALLLGALPASLRPFLRAGYTLGVAWSIAMLVPPRPVPRLVRFLSDATLPLYLYHQMIELLLDPHVRELWPPLRNLVLTAAGLGGATAVLFTARAALGPRSRWLVGA